MLDIQRIRDVPSFIDAGLISRNHPPKAQEILALDETLRATITTLQDLQAQRNQLAKDIALAKKNQSSLDPALIKKGENLKNDIASLQALEHEQRASLDQILQQLPNIPEDCPIGESEDDNVVVKSWKSPTLHDFDPKSHDVIGEALHQMNFEQGAKISGARFVVLYKDLARMERALSNFMLDCHTKEFGYTEVAPPLMVKAHAMFGTGQLPKMKEDLFSLEQGLLMIPTAEVALTNLVADEIVEASSLPLRYVASTPCFRSEAGAAGRDTKGMIRLHQFMKVELVSIVLPEESADEHERMTRCAEQILEKLDLAYRRMVLCSADMGFSSKKTYDLEVWMPGQGKYREISSCSNCGDFQARRMNARYRDGQKGASKPHYLHTLNGSGVAVGRALCAILENYQHRDGSVSIPHVLQPYMNGQTKIEKR
jgi:seryl-tRNA synthetase